LKIIKLKSFYDSSNVETNEKNSNKITVDMPKPNTIQSYSIESNEENFDNFDKLSVSLDENKQLKNELNSSLNKTKAKLDNEQKKEQETLKIESHTNKIDNLHLKVKEKDLKDANRIKTNNDSVLIPPQPNKIINNDKKKANKINKKASFKVGKAKESQPPSSLGLKEQETKKKKQTKNQREENKESIERKEPLIDETLVNMYASENELKGNDESSQDFTINLLERDESSQLKNESILDLPERRVRINLPNLPNLPSEQNINEEEEPEIDLNDALLKGLNAAEIREYKRKLAAEQRKQNLLKKRLEKEEAQRREIEEAIKREELVKKMEEERLRRVEEGRLARLAEAERKRKLEQEAYDLAAKLAAQEELERKMREEKLRQMDLLKFKMMEEMARKAKLEQERREEEERRRREEEAMLAALNEEERIRYLAQKQLEEEQRRLIEELERKQREEELERALREARERALEEARLKAELERHLRFIRSVHDESKNLTQSQSITRAFVFSYYELLQYLGHQVPSDYLQKTKQMGDVIKKYSMNNTK
jgi:hypothetical protein